MGKFDLQKDFIEYWDEVVRQWLEKNANYSEFENNAKEQSLIINAINDMFGDKPEYRLNTIHMPEPYWGNPTDCSIVLMNYNPAGGPRVNRHTTISCKDCTGCEPLSDKDKKIIPSMTFIKYVDDKVKEGENGYSSIALTGPVFKAKNGFEWFWDKDNGYEGYDWWQQKTDWLDHLVEIICGQKSEKRLPFAMELCGWHSKEWKTDLSWIDKESCRTIIQKRTILPLLDAMKNSLQGSSTKIAVCIGAGFTPSVLADFFNCNEDEFDVTGRVLSALLTKQDEPQDVEYKILGKDEIQSKKRLGKESKRSIGVAVNKGSEDKVETTRYYRVYKVDKNGDYIIFNTFAPGGNRHPAEHFRDFEKDLLSMIIEKKWKQEKDLFADF